MRHLRALVRCINVRKTTWLLVVALSLTIALGVAYAALFTDSGTVDVQVADRTTSQVDKQTAQGAFVSYFGDSDTTFGSAGSGVFDSFVRLQNTPNEQGYNTDAKVGKNVADPVLHDVTAGSFTHAILLSHIPQRPCPTMNPSPPPAVGSLTCFELFVDINESSSTPSTHVSLNKVEVYFTSDPNLTGYPFSGTATPEYAFNGQVLINDVNQGSGRGDLRYDIPINGPNPITIPANCNYGNPACTTYFVLYSQWGTTGTFNSIDYSSDGGFEEWKVKVYPAITLTKTPNVTDVCNSSSGTAVTYTYTVTNNSPGLESVSGSIVDDNGTPSNTADDVTVGTFTSLAATKSETFTHVFTVTGTRTNIATATATDSNGISTTATATSTVTGRTCTISLTKTPSTTDVCKGANTQVTYTYVVKNTGDLFNVSGSVSDDKYGSIGSFGPLAPNASATLTKVATVNDTITNTGTASGAFDDSKPTTASATVTATVTGHNCTISLTKTPSTTTPCNGANVTYTYVVTNNSNLYSVTGSVVDDNATPGNTADDVTVGTFTSLGAGASQTFTHVFTVNGTRTNIGTATGTFNDTKPTTATATASATVTGKNCAQITPTNTSCGQFASNTAATLTGVNYTLKSGVINSVSPGVFFYWDTVTASPGTNTITINQTITASNFSHFFSFAAGSSAFNASCGTLSTSITQNATTGAVTVTFNAGSGGTVFLGIKFDPTSVKGFPPPGGNGVAHYTFDTGQPGSTAGLDLSQKGP